MASIGQIDLQVEAQAAEAGAAFRLTDPARDDQCIVDMQGRVVSVKRDCTYVAVTFPSAPHVNELLTAAHTVAQCGLDIVSIQGDGDYQMASGSDGALIWWRHDGKTRLRYHSTQVVHYSVPPATVTVTSSDGKPVPPAPTPRLDWQPAFRYFRQSQIADDVFESYHNLYLALEAILSTYMPASVPSAGVLGDRQWTSQALSAVAASGVNLAPFVKPGTKSVKIVQVLFHEQYEALRCALFHAKPGKAVLLPGSLQDRKKVVQAHARLTGLITALLGARYGVQRRVGGVTPFAFKTAVESYSSTARMGVTDAHGMTESATFSHAVQGSDLSLLSTTYKGLVDENKRGSELEFDGRKAVDQLKSPSVNSIVFAVAPDALGDYFAVDQLVLDGVDILEVRLVLMMNNRRMPRTMFTY